MVHVVAGHLASRAGTLIASQCGTMEHTGQVILGCQDQMPTVDEWHQLIIAPGHGTLDRVIKDIE